MMEPVRWGVLGVSELVGRKAVLPALQRSPTAVIHAIGSRDLARAQQEAHVFGAAHAYGSYQEVLDDSAVEAVYIPLPNALHLPWTRAAAKAGKHVLCEKPLACTAAEASEMADACDKAGVLLMEAYMTPFHPRYARAIEIARSGRLGDLRSARTVFTFIADDPERKNYRWLPDMGGGALLDVGVYCLAPLLAIAGRHPIATAANAVAGPTGVDTTFSGWLDFGDGFTATFQCSFEARELQLLKVAGTLGRMTLERAFTPGTEDNLIALTGGDEHVTGNDPYLSMVEHFAAAIRGTAPSARHPSQSIETLSLLDRLRSNAGLSPAHPSAGST